MPSPLLVPRLLLVDPARFGRAGAVWTGWADRVGTATPRDLAPEVALATAWAQHHTARTLRRVLGYPSATDPTVDDRYLTGDDDWTAPHAAARQRRQFAASTGTTPATLDGKLAGRTLASAVDLHEWASRAGTTLGSVLAEAGPVPAAGD